MDNKLIELSKPVAYDYQVAGACIADGHNENGKWVDWDNKLSRYCPPDWMVEEGKVTGLKLLYSQEYVSALLAENERVASDLVARNGEIEGMKKRASELEAHNARLREWNAGLAQESCELQAKQEAMSLECRGIEQERELFRIERTAHQQHAQELEKRVAELSELETQVKVWEAAATKHLARTEEVEQRIAELSEMEAHNECLIKKNADLTQQNIKLGERLATPVRLPNKSDDEFWFDGVFQVAKFDRAVERAISAAGFKFVGDE